MSRTKPSTRNPSKEVQYKREAMMLLKALETAHQPILVPGPPHTSYLINDRVLNPGDSFDPKLLTWKGIDTLILPIMAPS